MRKLMFTLGVLTLGASVWPGSWLESYGIARVEAARSWNFRVVSDRTHGGKLKPLVGRRIVAMILEEDVARFEEVEVLDAVNKYDGRGSFREPGLRPDPLFAALGHHPFKLGPVTTVPISPIALTYATKPGAAIMFGARRYSITGDCSEGKQFGCSPGCGEHTLYVECGTSRQRLQHSRGIPRLEWIGDLDGDGFLDLIVSYGGQAGQQWDVYMSDEGGLMRLVGTLDYSYSC